MGLEWFPHQNLCQGNFKDDNLDGLQIIHNRATGKTDNTEYQDGSADGLSAGHRSDGIIWRTYSKG